MKHILVLEGSPRAGNTATVTDWVLAGMGRGMKVSRVRIHEKDINWCQECYTCAKSKKAAGCAQDDDMADIYDLMVDADLVLFTSPVFCWGVSGQLKTLLDRCFALMTGEGLLKGAKWALVMTAGGDQFEGADLAVEMFRRLARYFDINWVGQHIVPECEGGRALRRSARTQEDARAFGWELRKALAD